MAALLQDVKRQRKGLVEKFNAGSSLFEVDIYAEPMAAEKDQESSQRKDGSVKLPR